MSSRRAGVLLVEPEAGGHHFVPYAAGLARALADADVEVTLLTTRSATAHPAMGELLGAVGRPVGVSLMPEIAPAAGGGLPALLRAQWSYWRAVRDGWRALRGTARPGLAVLLGLDSVDRAIAVAGNPFGTSPFAGLTIQTKYHWPTLGIGGGGRLAAANRWSFRRVLARADCLGAATIDETLVDFEARSFRHGSKLRFVPDPGEVQRPMGRETARELLGIDMSTPMVLAYGGLDARKNLDCLLRAAVVARSAPLVVLAGNAGAELELLTASEPGRHLAGAGRLIVHRGFASLELEARLFSAADMAWVVYRTDFNGQSAIIPLAASAGVPSLGRRGGLIGRTIARHGLGLLVDPDDPRQVAEAIDRLQEMRRDGAFGDNLERFAATRSLAEHRAAWLGAMSAWWRPLGDRRQGGTDA